MHNNWYRRLRPSFIPFGRKKTKEVLEQLVALVDDPDVDVEVLPLALMDGENSLSQAVVRIRVKTTLCPEYIKRPRGEVCPADCPHCKGKHYVEEVDDRSDHDSDVLLLNDPNRVKPG